MRQLASVVSRAVPELTIGVLCPISSPATTTATTPDAWTDSAGTNAR